MFPTKALAVRVKWEPFLSDTTLELLFPTSSDCLLFTIWIKDHLELISHIFEILKINNLQIYNLQKLLCSVFVPVDEDNDDGGSAIPRAD